MADKEDSIENFYGKVGVHWDYFKDRDRDTNVWHCHEKIPSVYERIEVGHAFKIYIKEINGVRVYICTSIGSSEREVILSGHVNVRHENGQRVDGHVGEDGYSVDVIKIVLADYTTVTLKDRTDIYKSIEDVLLDARVLEKVDNANVADSRKVEVWVDNVSEKGKDNDKIYSYSEAAVVYDDNDAKVTVFFEGENAVENSANDSQKSYIVYSNIVDGVMAKADTWSIKANDAENVAEVIVLEVCISVKAVRVFLLASKAVLLNSLFSYALYV